MSRVDEEDERLPLLSSNSHGVPEKSESTRSASVVKQLSRCGHFLTSPALVTYILVVLFGMVVRLGLAAVSVEMPALVHELPEGWNLPSIWAIVVILGNLIPAVYLITRRCLLLSVGITGIIYTVLVVQVICFLLLAFLWDQTIPPQSAEQHSNQHSVAFLAIGFVVASCSAMMVVLSLPYMVQFPNRYLSVEMAATTTGSVIFALLGIAQGVGESQSCPGGNSSMINDTVLTSTYYYMNITPITTDIAPVETLLFSVRSFFFMVSGLTFLGIVAFTGLEYCQLCRQIKADISITNSMTSEKIESHNKDSDVEIRTNGPVVDNTPPTTFADVGPESVTNLPNAVTKSTNNTKNTNNESRSLAQTTDSEYDNTQESALAGHLPFDPATRELIPTITCQVAVYLMISFTCVLLPVFIGAILTYASLPYGSLTYSFAQRLHMVVSPILCILPMLTPLIRVRQAGLLLSLALIPAGYLTYLASTSPYPPLLGTTIGSILAVMATLFTIALCIFVVVAVAMALRASTGPVESRMTLFAISDQAGQTVGGLVAFAITSSGVFHQASTCK